jgi:hypothetical protein
MSEERKARRFRMGCLVYLLAALGLGGLLFWATSREVARNPIREVTADLGPHGFVAIQFTTSPYPPLPIGTVSLSFMPMDSRRRTILLDSLTYEYGLVGSDQPFGSGQAQPMADGSGMFMTSARFSTVGNWWVSARLVKGNVQDEVRFVVYVEPAR